MIPVNESSPESSITSLSPSEFSDWLVKKFQSACNSPETHYEMLSVINAYRECRGFDPLKMDNLLFRYNQKTKCLEVSLKEVL